MQKKKLVIMSSIFGICLISIVILANKIKINNTATSEESNVQYFQVEQENTSKFKGVSAISKEQKVIIDNSQGEINEILVTDKRYVQEGDILFTYYNEEMDEQLDEVQRQINSLDSKIKKQQQEVSKLPKDIQDEAFNTEEITELKGNLDELVIRRDKLKEKVNKAVTAELSGVVYIDDNEQSDTAKEFMRVVSKEPLVISEVSEFEVEGLKVDDLVEIKVVSNGERIDGKIIKVDDLPATSADNKSSAYKFSIKPEKEIRIGFSVEIAVNPQKIKIPKDFVIVENDRSFVNIINEYGNINKVEIKATLDGENYIVEDKSLKSGDKLILNPSDGAGGEN